MSEAVNSVAAEEKKTIVTKKDLLKAWWKWTLAVEVPVSFDRMQALAFGYSMNKVLRKLYKDDPEELQAAMRRHTSMFNTNCDWGSIIHGITISLEEQPTTRICPGCSFAVSRSSRRTSFACFRISSNCNSSIFIFLLPAWRTFTFPVRSLF